ncbi:MAG TPA: helix-turn-helix domain-containing protein [Dehalococcoidales bacterium]
MARKAIVDRETVLQMLREGKTSQVIADQYGVSRQAIDLYRKQFVTGGLLPETRTARPITTKEPKPGIQYTYRHTPEPAPEPKPVQDFATPLPTETPALSLDQMVDLIIQAFAALKRVPELEAETAKIRKSHDALLQQVEQLQSREQKRKEQEARWIHAQSPGIVADKQD